MAQPGDPTFGWDDDAGVEPGSGDQAGRIDGVDEQAPREVAVDAPGASRTYTYEVPARLSGIADGEAVVTGTSSSKTSASSNGSSSNIGGANGLNGAGGNFGPPAGAFPGGN